ncbi:hypothetical protein [uncultured Microbulbifer sp.]|uniref:hypothetical protein n=1 Tax=uncultured Microbulbifer sp. TaxID=348147 RepID=UPI00262D58E7|nr:hypothetical protein [uncultured Microbulbifer sp.]
MKEFIAAVNSRIKSPFYGYFILSFFVFNWRAIFLLLVTGGTGLVRLETFDNQTNIWTMLWYPLISSLILAIASPWVRYCFGLVERMPLQKIDFLLLDAEHLKNIRQEELEKSRNKLLAVKESELIDRALRDEKLEKVKDEEAKQNVKEEIDNLRDKRDNLSNKLEAPSPKLSAASEELLLGAASEERGIIVKSRSIGNHSIATNNISFGRNSPREFAKYEKALDDLVECGYVKERGIKGELFELSHSGWEYAEAVQSSMPTE